MNLRAIICHLLQLHIFTIHIRGSARRSRSEYGSDSEPKACRTRELSAELTVTREQVPPPPPRVRQNFERFLARVTKNSQNFAAHGGFCSRQ